jgi:hypothetical protein
LYSLGELDGVRCSYLREAYTGLVTIGELNPGRLQCALQSVHRRLLRISTVLDAHDSIGGDAGTVIATRRFDLTRRLA